MYTHPILSLLFLWIAFYVAAHAGMAGGAIDAGHAVGGVLPADAEVCGLGGTISCRTKVGYQQLLPRAHSFVPGNNLTPKSTHLRTTRCFRLDITFFSSLTVLRPLNRCYTVGSIKRGHTLFHLYKYREAQRESPHHQLYWALDRRWNEFLNCSGSCLCF